MKAIIIGAGRGSRLRHLTNEIPKTLVPVVGRPMLDHVLDALAAGGFARRDVVFICGYQADVIRRAYPELTFVENDAWPTNNILASLLYAREHMREGFVSTYADIVYRPEIVASLMRSEHDLTLVSDTDWRRRYQRRSQHPETDAEKLRDEGRRVVEISRRLASERATGEFIGVMRATPSGAERLLAAYDRAAARAAAVPEYREGRSFQKAYLLDLLADMVEAGEALYTSPTHGGYMEIDTLEDEALAADWWAGRG